MSQNQDIQKEIDAASDVLVNDVYAPTFVKCCADAGVPIVDADQLCCALESVAMLKAAEAARPASDMHKVARDELFAVMNRVAPDASFAAASRSLAKAAMQDDRVVKASQVLRTTA